MVVLAHRRSLPKSLTDGVYVRTLAWPQEWLVSYTPDDFLKGAVRSGASGSRSGLVRIFG